MTVDDRSQAVPPTPSARPGLLAWAVTAAAAGAAVVVFLDKAMLGIIARPVMAELGISATTFGAISSASYVLNVVTCLAVGFGASKVSPRWTLLACGLLWALGQAPAALAGGATLLVISRLAVGAAEGPAVPLAYAAAYSWFPADRRGVPAAVISSGAAFAKIALLPVLTLVIVAFGWRSGVVAVGVVALAWSSIWLRVGRLGSFAPRHHDADAGRATWPMLLSSRTVLGALVATFAQGALAAVVFTWLPSYFQIGLGFSAQASGVLFALPSVMAVIALFVIGGISDGMLRRGRSARTARGRLGGVCLTLAGAVLMTLPWVRVPPLAIALLVLGYGLSATVNTVAFPVVAGLVPADRRTGALACLAAASAAAGIVSPLVVGRLLDAAGTPEAGYTTAFLLFGGLLALGGLAFGLLVNPERDNHRARAPRDVAGAAEGTAT